jgi:hypothetical protein
VMAHMKKWIDADEAIDTFPKKYIFNIFLNNFLVLNFDEILYFIFLEFGWIYFNKL